jgi:hypothetical protein
MKVLKRVKKEDEKGCYLQIRHLNYKRAMRYSLSAEVLSYLKDKVTEKLRASHVEYFFSYHQDLPSAEAALNRLMGKRIVTFR